MTEVALRGRLLVATPALGDPNFDRTVVLLLEHGDDGALGVVLNRPSGTTVGEPLPSWDRFVGTPPVVFVGGPVAPGAVICLARTGPGEGAGGVTPVVGRVGIVDLERGPDELGATLEEIRVFAGYAGWAAGQLEEEIEASAWFVVDADPDDALCPDPESLWPTVLRRQGGRLAMFAGFPESPWLN